MTKLMSTIGAALGHIAKAFTITLGALLALWLFLDPEWVGQQRNDLTNHSDPCH